MGIVDKKTVGASGGGLIHISWLECGPDSARKFLTECQKRKFTSKYFFAVVVPLSHPATFLSGFLHTNTHKHTQTHTNTRQALLPNGHNAFGGIAGHTEARERGISERNAAHYFLGR